MSSLNVVLYHPTLAERYRELLRTQMPDVAVQVSSDLSEALSAMRTAEVLLAPGAACAALVAEAPRLRWVQAMSAGVERVVAVLPPGVRLSRLTGSFGLRMAEYVIGYAFAVAQRIPEVLENQRARNWKHLDLGILHGKVLGVAGLGSIGSAVVRLGVGVGMRVVGFSRTPSNLPELEGWYGPSSWHAFLREVDLLVLTLPVTPKTEQLLDGAAISELRPGALLVNVGRGSLVDEAALIEGLRRGRPAAAVLDVFATEPLPADSPLWVMPNVIVTPHHSGETQPHEVVDVFAANLSRFLKGEALLNEVDPARRY